jgi:ABC-type antimicrobial peptide transport system permease subunit
VAVLSHGFWVRRFGQDPDIIGRPISLDGVPTVAVGVMPSSYAFPDSRVDAWVPAPFATRTTATDAYVFAVIGRLRDGATIAEARSELTRLAVDLDPLYPINGYRALVSSATTLLDATVGSVAVTLWTLLAAVALVLVVACANVANLFLIRSEARQREIAVRRALGAGTRAIVQYFLTESMLLCLAGGAIGLALAWSAVHLLVAFGPANLPRHSYSPSVSWRPRPSGRFRCFVLRRSSNRCTIVGAGAPQPGVITRLGTSSWESRWRSHWSCSRRPA